MLLRRMKRITSSIKAITIVRKDNHLMHQNQKQKNSLNLNLKNSLNLNNQNLNNNQKNNQSSQT